MWAEARPRTAEAGEQALPALRDVVATHDAELANIDRQVSSEPLGV